MSPVLGPDWASRDLDSVPSVQKRSFVGSLAVFFGDVPEAVPGFVLVELPLGVGCFGGFFPEGVVTTFALVAGADDSTAEGAADSAAGNGGDAAVAGGATSDETDGGGGLVIAPGVGRVPRYAPTPPTIRSAATARPIATPANMLRPVGGGGASAERSIPVLPKLEPDAR